jgi:hypothetical protein
LPSGNFEFEQKSKWVQSKIDESKVTIPCHSLISEKKKRETFLPTRFESKQKNISRKATRGSRWMRSKRI